MVSIIIIIMIRKDDDDVDNATILCSNSVKVIILISIM